MGRKPFSKRLRRFAGNMITHHAPRRFTGQPYDVSDVVHDVKQLKKLINTEFKFDYTYATSTLDNYASPTVLLLNGLTRGNDANNRNGRSILIKSVQAKLNVEMADSVTDTKFRVMLVIDKQPNGSTLNMSSLLQSVGNETALMAPRNLNFRKRFIILRDQVMSLNEGVRRVGFFNYYRRMNMHTTYGSSDVGDISDIETNALYLIVFCNKTTTERPTITYNANIRFLDN